VIEAQVGIGGPLLGTAGAVLCEGCIKGLALRCSARWRSAAFFSIYSTWRQSGFLDGGRNRDGAVALVVACGPGDRQRTPFCALQLLVAADSADVVATAFLLFRKRNGRRSALL